MPEIPIYVSTQGPRNSVFHAPQAQDSGLGETIARGGAQLGAQLQKKQDERDDLWALQTLGEFKVRRAQKLKDRDNSAESSDNFTPLEIEDYDNDADAMLETAPSDRARLFLAEQAAQFRPHIYNDALRIETAKVVGEKVKSIHATTNSSANLAMTDPALGGDALQIALTAVRSSGLPSQMLPELEENARHTVGHSLVEGFGKSAKYGPVQTLARLRDGEFDQILSASSRRVLDNSLEADIRAAEASVKRDRNQERATWAGTFEDYKAAVSDGYIPTVQEADRYSDETIDYMLADDPKAAEAAKKELKAAYDAGYTMSDPSTTLPQKEATAAKLREKYTKDPTAYRDVDQTLNRVEAAIQKDKAAWASDAGGRAQKEPEVRETFEAYQQLSAMANAEADPAKKQKIIDERNAMSDEWLTRTFNAQIRNGQQSLKAPKSFVANEVMRIQEAQAVDIPRIVQELQGTAGKNFPRVMAEVSKGLGGHFTAVLGTAPPSPTTKLLADTMKMTTADMQKGLQQDQLDSLNELYTGDQGFKDWARASGEHLIDGGAESVKAFRSGTYRAALMYIKRDGASPRDAWRRALNDLTSEYSLVHENGVPYRIPVKAAGTADMQMQIETGAYSLRTGYEPPDNVLPPRGGVAIAQADLESYKGEIRRNGYFVTEGGDRGLILYAGGAPVQVLRPDGLVEPVGFTWAELAKAGAATQFGEKAMKRAKKIQEELDRTGALGELP